MNLRYPIAGAVFALTAFTRVSAQQTGDSVMALSSETAVHMALEANRALRQAAIDERTAAARYRETSAIFLPQAGISYTAMTTDNPLDAFGFKLQQSSATQADFNPSLLNHPGGTPDFLTSVDVKIPILNLDGLYQRKSAAAAIDVYRFRTQRTREGLIFQVKQAYMTLQLARQAVNVLRFSLVTADSICRFTADRVGQGMLSKADEANATVRVATVRSRLAEAQSEVLNASDALSLLMGQPADRVYLPTDTLQPAPIPTGSDTVSGERADFSALRRTIDAADLGIRGTQASALPRLNAFGSWQYNDARMFGFGAHAYMAGIQLSWNLFNGNSVHNKAVTQRLERDKWHSELQRQREQSDADLRKARRQLTDADLAIEEASSSIAAASQALRILRDRYRQGLTGSADVLQAQNQLEIQQLSFTRAVYTHNLTLAYIEFLTTH
jgi:outer membrane protein TolC